MTTLTWESPDGHTWGIDATHTPDGITRYLEALMDDVFRIGFEPNMRRLGSMLVGLRSTTINRRLFQRPVFVGVPDRPPRPNAGVPPKAVFTLLFAVHPELRRRKRNAERTLRDKPWRSDRERWRTELEPRWTRNMLELGAVDLGALDDEALIVHAEACTTAFRDGFATHLGFISDPVAVGDWLRLTVELTDAAPADALRALEAGADYRIGTLDGLSAVADAIASVPSVRAQLTDPDADPVTVLDAIRAHGGPARNELDRWLAHHGPRVVEACDVSGCTLGELPEVVVRGLAATLTTPPKPDAADPAALASLRDRVPPNDRAAWVEATEEAKAAYGFHDENVRILVAWPGGLARLALLEVGRRLVARGRLHAAEHMVEARPEQVGPLLRDEPGTPTADDLRAEYTQRIELARYTAPATVGPEPADPPFDRMPVAVRRINAAVVTYLEHVESAAAQTHGTHVSGLPVNAGSYTGRACVVTGPGEFGKLRQGDVLVARFTSPTYDVVLPLLGAAVTDRGGVLCHTAIVAREFGIPAVVGCRDATARIPDGAWVRVDGSTGDVFVLAAHPSPAP